MALGPGAGSANPFSTGTSATQNQYPTPQSYADFLNQHWPNKRITGSGAPSGANVGDQWLNWYQAQSAKYPQYALGQWEQAFFSIVASRSLGDAVANAASATGQATGQAATGIGQGILQFTSPLQFLQGLASGNLWVRVAKVVAGGLILTVGLVKLTGLDAKAPKIVKTAVKAAPLL